SRGYKRKSRGYRMVRRGDTALTVGDEPLQYFLKYPQIGVAVSESRSIGIPLMLSEQPNTQVILLDDSYQHLSVTPYLNILLTEFDAPYSNDILLPAGRLREWKSGADRADIIIVSKCPENLSLETKTLMRDQLEIKPHQALYFSKYRYDQPYHLLTGMRHQLNQYDNIILVTAIANESYLLTHLSQSGSDIHTMTYEDHHVFSPHEVSLLKQQYDHLAQDSKTIILTTEKDATRLILHREYIEENRLPILVLPIHVTFLDQDGNRFNQQIQEALLNFKY
ncbi:MAG: tetraacyldisaccharide 4'-kinase, partial [Flavobacteriaceae bacterium]|nr:tetraacyldisaccharide 4'-kinase [Flavobacteriaceae bacterium]